MNGSAITNKETQKAVDRRTSSLMDQHRRDLLSVLSTEEGRRVLWHIIDDLSGLHSFSLVADNGTFLSEGRRSVGGRLVLELQQASVELYTQMTREAISSGLATQTLMQGDGARKDEDNGG